MATKHFCDGCDVELSPNNRAQKGDTAKHTFDNGHKFEIGLGVWSSNVAGLRMIHNDGDLCKDCISTILLGHLDLLPEDPDLQVEEEEPVQEEA